MAFKLKDKSTLFGYDKQTSTHNNPVFEKDLGGKVMAEANRDGTIFIDKGLSPKQKQDAVAHEKVHLNQMQQNRLDYTDDTVTWKKDTRSPARVYRREDMMEGAHNLEWEKEAYSKPVTQKSKSPLKMNEALAQGQRDVSNSEGFSPLKMNEALVMGAGAVGSSKGFNNVASSLSKPSMSEKKEIIYQTPPAPTPEDPKDGEGDSANLGDETPPVEETPVVETSPEEKIDNAEMFM